MGIDCDGGNSNIIALSGAIHCITHSVGVEDPDDRPPPLNDTENDNTPYAVVAEISHRSGIASATLSWSTSADGPWNEVTMSEGVVEGEFAGNIPAQPVGTKVFYFVSAEANSGKSGNRPMPAPAGHWSFKVWAARTTSCRQKTSPRGWPPTRTQVQSSPASRSTFHSRSNAP